MVDAFKADAVKAEVVKADVVKGDAFKGDAFKGDVLKADVFKALADHTRRTILDELADRNGQTLFEICARLATKHGLSSSRQAISQHLDILEASGLVETRRDGRYKFHYFNTGPLEPIIERWLTKSCNRHEHGPARPAAPRQREGD